MLWKKIKKKHSQYPQILKRKSTPVHTHHLAKKSFNVEKKSQLVKTNHIINLIRL